MKFHAIPVKIQPAEADPVNNESWLESTIDDHAVTIDLSVMPNVRKSTMY